MDIAFAEWFDRKDESSLFSSICGGKLSVWHCEDEHSEGLWSRRPTISALEAPIKLTNKTYVEFGGKKEMLFDRWCLSKNVNKEYARLCQLVLIEGLSINWTWDICWQTEGGRWKASSRLLMIMSLTHTPVFKNAVDSRSHKGGSSTIPSASDTSSHSPRHTSSEPPVRRSQWLPTGPTCYNCKKGCMLCPNVELCRRKIRKQNQAYW